MGHGWAPAVTALEYGVPIGLSSDVATTASSDQFTQMHSIFGSERGRKHQEAWDADLDGLQASPGLITSRQVLEWATHRRRPGRRDRRPHRLAHARQEGRHRDHRRVGRERRADHRPGRARWSARPTSRTSRPSSSTARSSRRTSSSRRRSTAPRHGGRGVARLPPLEVRRSRARLAAREGHWPDPRLRARPGGRLSERPPGTRPSRGRRSAAPGRTHRERQRHPAALLGAGRRGGRPTSRPGARSRARGAGPRPSSAVTISPSVQARANFECWSSSAIDSRSMYSGAQPRDASAPAK